MGTKLCLSEHASLLASGLLHQTIPDILLASQVSLRGDREKKCNYKLKYLTDGMTQMLYL